MSTNEYFHHVKADGWSAAPGGLWQRGYFEHIVRSSRGLDRFRKYIADNPLRWHADRENPQVAEIGRDEIDQIIAEDCPSIP